eukprot:37124_1
MTTTVQILLSSSIDDILGQEPITYDNLQKLSQKLNLLQIAVRKRALNEVIQPIKKQSVSKICNFWYRNPSSNISSVKPVHAVQIKNKSKPSKQMFNVQDLVATNIQLSQEEEEERKRIKMRLIQIKEKWKKKKLEMQKIKKLIEEKEKKVKYEWKQKQESDEKEMKRNEENETKKCILPLTLMNIAFEYYEYNDLLCDWSKIEDDERYPTIYSLWIIYSDGKMYKKINSKTYIKKERESLEFEQQLSKNQIQTLKTLLICYPFSHKMFNKRSDYEFNNYGQQIAKWYNIYINDYNIDHYEIGKKLFLFLKNELNVYIPNHFIPMEKPKLRW